MNASLLKLFEEIEKEFNFGNDVLEPINPLDLINNRLNEINKHLKE